MIGVGFPNRVDITSEDARRYRLARFQGAVVFDYQTPYEVTRLADPAYSVVRLQDTIWTKWPQDEKYIPSWEDMVEYYSQTILRWYNYGFRVFVLDNEPNYSGSWPRHGKGAWDWARTMHQVMPALLSKIPGDVVLLFTPMVHTEGEEWYRASEDTSNYGVSLVSYFHGVRRHCYWQRFGDMASGMFGANFKELHSRFGLPVWVTEAGNSKIQAGVRLDEVQTTQAAEYPVYIDYTRRFDSYLRGVYFFILSSDGWQGFEFNDAMCQGVRSRM